MKTKPCILFLIAIAFSIAAKGQTTFQEIIDTMGISVANSIQETFDNGFIICGQTNNNDAFIAKLDSIGRVDWAKVFGGSGFDSFSTVQQISDSGYMVNGSYNNGTHTLDWQMAFNKLGDTLWSKKYSLGIGATNTSGINSMDNINFNFYGSTGNYKTTYLTPFFINKSSSGSVLFNKIYNTPFSSTGDGICSTFDSAFVIVGGGGTSFTTSDAYLLKIAENGDTIFQKQYDLTILENAYAVIQKQDTGFFIGGISYDTTVFTHNLLLINTDRNGDTLWARSFHYYRDQTATSVAETHDHAFIVTGTVQKASGLSSDLYLLKVNQQGDTIWTRTYGEADYHDYGNHVQQTHDGGYIVSGGNNGLNFGAYIIKTDSMGLVAGGLTVPEVNNPYYFTVAPNPSSGIFTITAKCFSGYPSTLKIFNAANQCIYQSSICHNTPQTINLSNEPPGMYFIMLSNAEKMVSKKLVIEK